MIWVGPRTCPHMRRELEMFFRVRPAYGFPAVVGWRRLMMECLMSMTVPDAEIMVSDEGMVMWMSVWFEMVRLLDFVVVWGEPSISAV